MTQSIDPTFSARMRELRLQAASLYNSLICTAQRAWQVPKAQTTSMFNIAEMHKPAFDRGKLNDDYMEIVAGKAPGDSGGEVLGLRLQIAAVAAEERAYRHRHMSMVRAICTAHGRSYGQGFGSIFGPKGIEGDAATYIRSGSPPTDIMAVEPLPSDGSVVV